MLVSIVIPVYNGSLLIERCLNSIFQQQGSFDLEVICVDDGSTDTSVEILKKYPKPVKLIQQSNQGPAAARNNGINAATGIYLAFLDADDYWKPGFLSETITFLQKHSEAVAVSVAQEHMFPGKQAKIVPELMESEQTVFMKPVIIDNFFSFWAQHSHVCTGSILIRTKIAKETGGQRTELRITEDLEFWAYLATYGPMGFIPKVLFVSDGGLITKHEGWLKKNQKRWNSAPAVEKWEERIITALNERDRTSYYKARGKIAKNLCYSMIMSKRGKQAREICTKYGNDFPTDKVSKLLVAGSGNEVLWSIIVVIIRFREYMRIV